MYCLVGDNCDNVGVSELEKAASSALSSWDDCETPGGCRRNLKGQEGRALRAEDRRELKSRTVDVSLNNCSVKSMASSMLSAMSSESSDSSTSSADMDVECVSETLLKSICPDADPWTVARAVFHGGSRRLSGDVTVSYAGPNDDVSRTVDCEDTNDIADAVRGILER
jgi:hypothetical protein